MKSLNHGTCSFRSFPHEEKVSCHEGACLFAACNFAVSCARFQKKSRFGKELFFTLRQIRMMFNLEGKKDIFNNTLENVFWDFLSTFVVKFCEKSNVWTKNFSVKKAKIPLENVSKEKKVNCIYVYILKYLCIYIFVNIFNF